jgi:uncharacterized protein (TIGR03000 family)
MNRPSCVVSRASVLSFAVLALAAGLVWGQSPYHQRDPVVSAPALEAMLIAPVDERAVLIFAHVPADAEVWFDNERMAQTGPERVYVTPPLPKNSRYSYDMKARWTEEGSRVDRSQRVSFMPGDRVRVEFRTTAEEAGSDAVRAASPVLPPGQIRVLTPGIPVGGNRPEVPTQPAPPVQPGTQPATAVVPMPVIGLPVGGVPIVPFPSNPPSKTPPAPNASTPVIPSSTPVIPSSNPAVPDAPAPAATPAPGTTPAPQGQQKPATPPR